MYRVPAASAGSLLGAVPQSAHNNKTVLETQRRLPRITLPDGKQTLLYLEARF